MTYFKFKQILRKYCKEFDIKFPLISNQQKLHKAYEESLWTAPVEDNDITLGQFLDSTNWTEIFEDKMPSYRNSLGERFEYIQPLDKNKSISETNYCLAPLPKAVPASDKINGLTASWIIIDDVIKEEGKTPMRYNDNYASASANVTTVQSDAAVQRDYLLNRLSKAQYPKEQSFTKLFNLYVDNTPKTYKELIDAIKNDKFTLDPKAVKKVDKFSDEDNEYPEGFNPFGAFFGIVWEGLTPDPEGYQAAVKELCKQATAAKDIIMTGDAADGLKALQDFEAWLPDTSPSTSTSVN